MAISHIHSCSLTKPPFQIFHFFSTNRPPILASHHHNFFNSLSPLSIHQRFSLCFTKTHHCFLLHFEPIFPFSLSQTSIFSPLSKSILPFSPFIGISISTPLKGKTSHSFIISNFYNKIDCYFFLYCFNFFLSLFIVLMS